MQKRGESVKEELREHMANDRCLRSFIEETLS